MVLYSLDAGATWVIPPGREAIVLEFVRAAVAETPNTALLGVSVNGGMIAARVSRDGQDARELALAKPGDFTKPTGQGWTLLRGNIWLRCNGLCSNEENAAWQSFAPI